MQSAEQIVTPIEQRKRSNLGQIYGVYLMLWFAGLGGYVCFTESGDETAPVWFVVLIVGKTVAFWCVYGIYRFLTRKRPRTVSIFCGSCGFPASAIFAHEDGGYQFRCYDCGKLNIERSG